MSDNFSFKPHSKAQVEQIFKKHMKEISHPIKCPHCGKEIVVKEGKQPCPNCGKEVDLTLDIKFDN